MASPMGISGFISIMYIIYMVIILGSLTISIYGFVLFVKLARRGIKALDIYIEEKENKS